MNGVLFVPPSVLPTVEPLARIAAWRGLGVVSEVDVGFLGEPWREMAVVSLPGSPRRAVRTGAGRC